MLPSVNVGSNYIEYLVVMTVYPGKLQSVCSLILSQIVCSNACHVNQLTPIIQDFSNIIKYDVEGVLRFEVHCVAESNRLFFSYL